MQKRPALPLQFCVTEVRYLSTEEEKSFLARHAAESRKYVGVDCHHVIEVVEVIDSFDYLDNLDEKTHCSRSVVPLPVIFRNTALPCCTTLI